MSKRILCHCEDVTLEEFRRAYRDGFTELESLKRFTGVGTGFCQGKGCLCAAAEELARLRGVAPAEIPLTNIRPPVEPLTFAELAALEVPPLVEELEGGAAADGRDDAEPQSPDQEPAP